MRPGFQRLSLTAVALLAGLGYAASSFAQPATPGAKPAAPQGAMPAAPQAGNPAGNESAMPKGATARTRTSEGWAERQLGRLHRQLDITSAQEGDWAKFADATRQGAQNIEQLYRERSQNFETMSASPGPGS